MNKNNSIQLNKEAEGISKKIVEEQLCKILTPASSVRCLIAPDLRV